ncbi:hypothetical protein FQR65_LT20942 [Abscondita terminalis]|nr:hypothetical protein FQR65_LT20942 [Abscondita terminalis]
MVSGAVIRKVSFVTGDEYGLAGAASSSARSCGRLNVIKLAQAPVPAMTRFFPGRAGGPWPFVTWLPILWLQRCFRNGVTPGRADCEGRYGRKAILQAWPAAWCSNVPVTSGVEGIQEGYGYPKHDGKGPLLDAIPKVKLP